MTKVNIVNKQIRTKWQRKQLVQQQFYLFWNHSILSNNYALKIYFNIKKNMFSEQLKTPPLILSQLIMRFWPSHLNAGVHWFPITDVLFHQQNQICEKEMSSLQFAMTQKDCVLKCAFLRYTLLLFCLFIWWHPFTSRNRTWSWEQEKQRRWREQWIDS